MTEPGALWLALLDCSGIQRYVFGSYRLADNVGGSFLVESALGLRDDDLLAEALDAGTGPGRVRRDWAAEDAPWLPDDRWPAVVLYVGGGNAVVLFRDEGQARAALAALGRRLLERAPGLRVNASLIPWLPAGTAPPAPASTTAHGLATALLRAFRDLNTRKLADTRRLGPAGHPVARTCPITGLTAAQERAREPAGSDRRRATAIDTREWLATGAAARRDAAPAGNARLAAAFRDDPRTGAPLLGRAWGFPINFAQLGGRLGERHLAVVHADGNGLGQLLHQRLRSAAGDDEAAAGAARSLSRTIATASDAALASIVTLLTDPATKGELEREGIAYHEGQERGRQLLPFRPIVYGGDDVTFVCDGRLGIQLAARFLQALAAEADGLTACAGVAIVRAGFPFTRAYELAEELCQNAKRRRRLAGDSGSWLDFHVARSGVGGNLRAIRLGDYGPLAGSPPDELEPAMLRRPWRVSQDPAPDDVAAVPRSDDLAWLLGCAAHLTAPATSRPWSRSRLKRLAGALERGRTVAGDELRRLRWRGARLAPYGRDDDGEDGYVGEVSPLYDVLDALDYLSRTLLATPGPAPTALGTAPAAAASAGGDA